MTYTIARTIGNKLRVWNGIAFVIPGERRQVSGPAHAKRYTSHDEAWAVAADIVNNYCLSCDLYADGLLAGEFRA